MDQQVCLRWNNFQSSLTATLENMWDEESLVDVTLFCEGQEIRAHKVVLSACSLVFKSLFKSNSCPHPIIILHSVKLSDIEAILQFIYKGEVNIDQENLNSLLQTATSLQIRGLAGIAERDKVEEKIPEPPPKRMKKNPTKSVKKNSTSTVKKKPKLTDKETEEPPMLTPKQEPTSDDDTFHSDNEKEFEDTGGAEGFDNEDPLLPSNKDAAVLPPDNPSIESQGNFNQGFTCKNSQYPPYPCPFCCRAYASWGFRRRHIKAMHSLSPELPCKWCSTVLPSRDGWENHVVSEHNLSKSEAEQGLTVLEEAHMVLQNPHPSRLNALVDMVQESQSQSNDKD